MNKKTVTIKFDLKDSGKKAAEIIIKDLNDAIAANSDNFEFLEEMRKEFLFGIMGVERLQARIKYPDVEDPNKDVNAGWL